MPTPGSRRPDMEKDAHDPFFGAVRAIFPTKEPAPLKKRGWLPWFEVLCSWPYRGLTASPCRQGVVVGLVMAGSPEPWGLVSIPATLTPDAAREFASRLIAAADAATHHEAEA